MLLILLFALCSSLPNALFPIVMNTWSTGGFTNATETAWAVLVNGKERLAALVEGLNYCEVNQCGFDVGYGGSPDENAETTLDAVLIDGVTMNVGAVAQLRRIKDAIKVANSIMTHTQHTLLASDSATEFAIQNGFVETSLTTPYSQEIINNWTAKNCQPNYRQNVYPDPTKSCGPYSPIKSNQKSLQHADTQQLISEQNHDTISMLIIDSNGNTAAGTTTNGLTYKVPGRVGDASIPGAGSYANEIGVCGATGDGDIMVRFASCLQVLETIRYGGKPKDACENALKRIAKYFPTFRGALIAISRSTGEYGGACWGWNFTYSIRTPSLSQALVVNVSPIGP